MTSPDKSRRREPEVGTLEQVVAFAFLAVASVLRVLYAFRYTVDSDEPQHLHVVWGWVKGLVQYRDRFDNHSPLFHMLYAPVMALIGERADVLLWMRLAELPFFFLTLWGVHRIGTVLYSQRVGLWGAVLAALVPPFFFCSLEFRPDGAWAAVWIAALAVLVNGPLTSKRSFLVGLLLGTATAISMKTILMLASLAGAGVIVVGFRCYKDAGSIEWGRWGRCSLFAILGFVLVPLSLICYFVAQGAAESLYYGTIAHNLLVKGPNSVSKRVHLGPFVIALVTMAMVAWSIYRRAGIGSLGLRRALVFLATALFVALLYCIYPVFEYEHRLPYLPLISLHAAAVLALPISVLAFRRIAWLALALVAAGELVWMVVRTSPLHDGAQPTVMQLADVLRLTDPKDYIIDVKGETIFRPRPCYQCFELITNDAIKRGLIRDEVPEALTRTKTCVAAARFKRFTPRGLEFWKRNYINVGTLSVAGRFLVPPADGSPLRFNLELPSKYAILSTISNLELVLDGSIYDGPRFLDSGIHEVRFGPNSAKCALVWAQAVERGFSPFHGTTK